MKQYIVMHDQKANQMALAFRQSQEATLTFIGKFLVLLAVWGLGMLTGLA